MKVLIFAGQSECEKLLDDLSGIDSETVFIHGREAMDIPANPAGADIIIGGAASGDIVTNSVLTWRCHHHTYLTPCWFPLDREALAEVCLWPALAIDRFDRECKAGPFSEWLLEVAQWQQNRMHFPESGDVRERSGLELATALCFRRATGVLSIFDDEGAEGEFFLRDGNLISASFKHLREVEAFYELLCTTRGGYAWNGRNLPKGIEQHPLSLLIAEGLKVIGEANFLYRFAPNTDRQVRTTDSQSALDDAAAKNFTEQKEIYRLIEKTASLSQILGASPLSRPSTMAILAKWFSLGDIAVASEPVSRPECRVLVVDDSPLICNVLQTIFEGDQRMSVAGIAHDGIEALKLIGEVKPDVVTLDLQMPNMDGLTALKHILIREPRPVVVLSAFTEATSRLTYESFKYGAVEVMQKPRNAVDPSSQPGNIEFCDRIVQASHVQLAAVRYIRRREKSDPDSSNAAADTPRESDEKVLLVLCGAGGIPSLLKLIFALPASKPLPLTLIGVDIPGQVADALVSNVKRDSPIPMERLCGPGPLTPGRCYVVSNEERYRVSRENNRILVDQNGEKPAENTFFDDLVAGAADCLKSRLTAMVLSGADEDGVEGMRRVKEVGGQVFALTPGACLRPELPERLIGLGYAQEVKNIEELSRLFDIRQTRVHPESIGEATELLSDSDFTGEGV